LKAYNSQLSEFFGIILEKITDLETINKCFESLMSFCQLGCFELLHFPKLVEIGLKYMGQEQFFESVIEVIKNSVERFLKICV